MLTSLRKDFLPGDRPFDLSFLSFPYSPSVNSNHETWFGRKFCVEFRRKETVRKGLMGSEMGRGGRHETKSSTTDTLSESLISMDGNTVDNMITEFDHKMRPES